jgi:hypothetical protein
MPSSKPSSVPVGSTRGSRVRLAFSAWAPAPSGTHLDPAEAELYTRPSEGLIKVSTRVAGLAARLTGDERDPLAVVRRFWTYMLDEMARGAIDYDRLGCAAPLDRGSDVSRCDF